MQTLTMISRYTDVDGDLERSLSWGSLYYNETALQKIIPGFLGSS